MTARFLAGVVHLPYVTPAGRLVVRHGWDPETGFFLALPRELGEMVPDRPTPTETRDALQALVKPWSCYRFADSSSAGAMVSAVLAAVLRPVLDICPAYLIDASTQGSGKTKAATALGALMKGERPGVTPYSAAGSEEEMRKRLFAMAREGEQFSCLDNVVGYFRSAALSAAITGGSISDRVLGASDSLTVRWRGLFTLTANNGSLDADLARRTAHVRIDSGEAPTARVFEFCPVVAALTQRYRVAFAVCTVLRAYFNAGAPTLAKGDAGGFADWNRLCRQPLLWLQAEGLAAGLPWGTLGDPASAMLADASSSDPDLEAWGDALEALKTLTHGEPFTAKEAAAWVASGAGPGAADLQSAVRELLGHARGEISVRSLGRLLTNRRDRVVRGLKLMAGGTDHGRAYRVANGSAGGGGGGGAAGGPAVCKFGQDVFNHP